jgi:hypothetical protein
MRGIYDLSRTQVTSMWDDSRERRVLRYINKFYRLGSI